MLLRMDRLLKNFNKTCFFSKRRGANVQSSSKHLSIWARLRVHENV